jgi:hypothetical protein
MKRLFTLALLGVALSTAAPSTAFAAKDADNKEKTGVYEQCWGWSSAWGWIQGYCLNYF